MSQTKVDKRKQEKKNLAAKKRKQKIGKIIGGIVTVLVICGIIASFAVYNYIKSRPSYIDKDDLHTAINEEWKDKGYDSIFTAKTPTEDTTEASTADENLETEVDSSAVENDNSSEETEAATTEEQN